jgi:hypothetical protein
MAHVSEDYGAAPPDAATVRAQERLAATPRPKSLPARVKESRAANACVASVRNKIGALCPPRLKALPA